MPCNNFFIRITEVKKPVNQLKPGEGQDLTNSGENIWVLCSPIAPQVRHPTNTRKNQGLHLNNKDIMPSPKRGMMTLLPQSGSLSIGL